jgi:hypothetical protein
VASTRLILAASLLLFVANSTSGQSIHFRDISSSAGMGPPRDPALETKYIVEMMGGGVALFDCDNSGKLSIVAVNNSTVDEYLHGGAPMITLYRQVGDLHFADQTVQAGLTTRGWGMGIAIGDYDNDGLPDIFVTGYGHNALYHNLGDCKFEDVTERAHVSGGGFSVGAGWADYDRDGKLDLFVDHYTDSDVHDLPQPGSRYFGYRGQAMEALRTVGQTSQLYHNRGDGTFEDVAEKAGLNNPQKRLGMGLVWADYDNDGWPDLFVTNDMGANYLFRNRHDGTFEDEAFGLGVATGEDGEYFGNMAGDFADIDHSGKLDLLITRYRNQPMSLYANRGDKGFDDITKASKLDRGSAAFVRWGSGFADFNNDGWADILVANGNFTPVIDAIPTDPKYAEPLQVFRNNGDRTFTDDSAQSGLDEGALHSRRGTAFGDLNNDGNIDAVVFNSDGPPSIFLNISGGGNHSVLFHLVGTKSNRAAIGARVIVTMVSANGHVVNQMDEVRGGSSYLSSSDQRVHFGLGPARIIRRVQIQWPSGLKEDLRNVPAGAIYTVVEGQGIKGSIKFNAAAK